MQNIFQEGDLIFYDLKGPNKDFLPSKLTTPYKDPYVVLSQYTPTWVPCRSSRRSCQTVLRVPRRKLPLFPRSTTSNSWYSTSQLTQEIQRSAAKWNSCWSMKTVPSDGSHGTKTYSIAYHTKGMSVRYHNLVLFSSRLPCPTRKLRLPIEHPS